jgi:hypothetical protein
MYSMTVVQKTAEGEKTVFTSEEVLHPQWIINQSVQGFDLGRLIAQTKGQTEGTLAYERGRITYKVKD